MYEVDWSFKLRYRQINKHLPIEAEENKDSNQY